MNRLRFWWIFLALAFPGLANAHVGSPDVFFDGNIGPYPARVTIRMPSVIPGRAEITVRAQAETPVEVSFLPLYSNTALTNAPPADRGALIRGETNLYTGDLWLMSFGAYTIQVKLRGPAGEGTVEIPVNAIAMRQLPLPAWLGGLLALLLALLVFGGLAIVAGAARESELEPGRLPDRRARQKGWLAGGVTGVALVLLLLGGNRWWNSEEKEFQRHLTPSAWPDLEASVRVAGSRRNLDLTLGQKDLSSDVSLALAPDHGKLLHFFLIREGSVDAIGHLHPVRKAGRAFQVALPPLPQGRYKIFCDLTMERSGLSYTATNSVELPAIATAGSGETNTVSLEPDPDDSWAVYPAESVPPATATNAVYQFPGGGRVVWRSHAALKTRQDAGLQFEVFDAAGDPAELEPYMGMTSHAAVMRRDEAIFAHLHPMGNYSMAAQGLFQKKIASETATAGGAEAAMPAGMDHSKMGHMMHNMPGGGSSLISLPYEFPTAGDYRIWVQFKTGGKVMTAVFDATVAGR